MKSFKKIIFTVSIMVLMAGIIVAGVFATSSGRFRVSMKLCFTASGSIDVVCYISGTNAGNAMSIENDTISITEASSPSISYPEQTFAGAGESNAIIYNITLQNNSSSKSFRAKIREEASSDLTISYRFQVAGEEETTGQAELIAYPGETINIYVTYILNDAGTSVTPPSTFNIVLSETTDYRTGNPDNVFYVIPLKTDYVVNESIAEGDLILKAWKEEISLYDSRIQVEYPDMTQAGTNPVVTIHYYDYDVCKTYTADYTIYIRNKMFNVMPLKTEYLIGEDITNDDLQVELEGELVTGFTIVKPNMNVLSEWQEVIVSYTDEAQNTYSGSYSISISEYLFYSYSSGSMSLNGVKTNTHGKTESILIDETDLSTGVLTQTFDFPSQYYIVIMTEQYFDSTANDYKPWGGSYIIEPTDGTTSTMASWETAMTYQELYNGREISYYINYFSKEYVKNNPNYADFTSTSPYADTASFYAKITLIPRDGPVDTISISYIDSSSDEIHTDTMMLQLSDITGKIYKTDSKMIVYNSKGWWGGPLHGFSFEGKTFTDTDNNGVYYPAICRLYNGNTIITDLSITCRSGYYATIMNYDQVFDISQIEGGWNILQVYFYNEENVEVQSIQIFIYVDSPLSMIFGDERNRVGFIYNIDATYKNDVENNLGDAFGYPYFYNINLYADDYSFSLNPNISLNHYINFTQNGEYSFDSSGNLTIGSITYEIYDESNTNKLTGFTNLSDYHNFFYIRKSYGTYTLNTRIDLYLNPYYNDDIFNFGTNAPYPWNESYYIDLDQMDLWGCQESRNGFMTVFHPISMTINESTVSFNTLQELIDASTFTPNDSSNITQFEILNDNLVRFTLSDSEGNIIYEKRIYIYYA